MFKAHHVQTQNMINQNGIDVGTDVYRYCLYDLF